MHNLTIFFLNFKKRLYRYSPSKKSWSTKKVIKIFLFEAHFSKNLKPKIFLKLKTYSLATIELMKIGST